MRSLTGSICLLSAGLSSKRMPCEFELRKKCIGFSPCDTSEFLPGPSRGVQWRSLSVVGASIDDPFEGAGNHWHSLLYMNSAGLDHPAVAGARPPRLRGTSPLRCSRQALVLGRSSFSRTVRLRPRLVEDGKPYRNDAMWQLHEDLVAAASWERRGSEAKPVREQKPLVEGEDLGFQEKYGTGVRTKP